jgi:uncharacterized protein
MTISFNVAGLLKDPVGATREYAIAEPLDVAGTGLAPASPVVGTVRFTRTQQGVLAEGQVRVAAEQTCSRCLEPVSSPVTLAFEEEFRQTLDIHTGLPVDVPGESKDDQAVLIDAHHVLALDELIRQYLLAWLPMHPLCREDCQGLCPECGRNLNEGPCGCSPSNVDGRWQALGGFLKAERKP